MKRAMSVLVLLVIAAAAFLFAAAEGWLGTTHRGGTIVGPARAPEVATAGAAAERAVAPPDAPADRQILFGDLHVHSIFSTDANLMSLPMMQGDGPHPPADACDFARYCSRLDFFSMNDHAEALTPQRWSDTRDSIRQCNALADPHNPDLVAFLGYEWTQMSQQQAENHYGHKNVVFRDTEEGKVPVRPIAARNPGISLDAFVPPLRQRIGLPLLDPAHMKSYLDFNRFSMEMLDVPACPDGVDTRELPENCRESAATPAELFRKLDEGGHASIVIPHGNTWGIYTAMNSTWDKQLAGDMQDPARQFLVEIYSGHGNSEEYRAWTPALQSAAGRSCPEPSGEYLPVCWQAGEIIRGRCLAGGADAAQCEQRAAEARQRAVDAGTGNEFGVAAGADVAEWLDSGQCRDCFLPAFNYRPGGATQYALAIGNFDAEGEAPRRFRFGVIASSDVHSSRPGTGYKEFARIPMTEARGPGREGVLEAIRDYDGPQLDRARTPEEMSRDMRNLLFTVMERQSSFWLTGGLAAVHSESRRREDIWAALQRKEVYGTSGPRILLWFDLLDGAAGRRVAPMGSERSMAEIPHFRVTAAGSFEQKPGCPQDSIDALGAERLANLCLGECYFPGDRRRPISRIEVVRIRPQVQAGEAVEGLIEDPWRVFPCTAGAETCTAEFADEEFPGSGREALYYARAIEAPSLAVNADPLRCERDASGACVRSNPCVGDFRTPKSEDCLAPTEERAWSSPIFLDPVAVQQQAGL